MNNDSLNTIERKELKDMKEINEYSTDIHSVFSRIAHYLSQSPNHKVMGNWKEEMISSLPNNPPEEGVGIQATIDFFQEKIGPGLLRWNSPNFMGYFSSSASLPAIAASTLGVIHNSNRMLKSGSPVVPELDLLAGEWYQQLLQIPSCFEPQWYYGASQSYTHFLAMAINCKTKGRFRNDGLVSIGQRFRIYKSELAHFFVEKSAIAGGIGVNNIINIPTNSIGEMDVIKLRQAIEEDISKGYQPLMIICTIATTSITAVDPAEKIADICEIYNLFFYIDAAYGGSFAALPEFDWIRKGWERADAICINPHKQLMVPLGCSLLFIKDRQELRNVCHHGGAYIPDNASSEGDPMDFTFYCGMPVNSLAPFFNMMTFGAQGIREYLRRTVKLAQEFVCLIEGDPIYTIVAPCHFSTVCFRAQPKTLIGDKAINYFNKYICEEINSGGEIFISRTKVENQTCLRLTVGNINASSEHIKNAYKALYETAEEASKFLTFRMLANRFVSTPHVQGNNLLCNRFWSNLPAHI